MICRLVVLIFDAVVGKLHSHEFVAVNPIYTALKFPSGGNFYPTLVATSYVLQMLTLATTWRRL